MRTGFVAALLLALLALVPAGSTTPLACADPCVVQSHSAAAVPVVVQVPSGGSVVWTSLDTSHVNVDGVGVGDEDACFRATFNPASPSKPVRFDIADGALKATTTLTATQQVVRECALAEAMPDGSFLVEYYCALHPQMRAALLVVPA